MEITIVIALIILSGLFSGLTLGLLSLSKDELERKIKLGDKDAEKVYSVRKNGNLLLCTLLLGNVAVNSVLSIFLGSIASGLMAGIVSTALIVVFGEILPQSFCSKYPLMVGAKTTWIVKLFQFLLYPIVKPLSMALDKLLGAEMPTIYSRSEFAEMIKTHEDSDESKIDSDEEKIILGALTYSDKKVEDVMTPKSVVFMIEEPQEITTDLLNQIKSEGHTRIPVYSDNTDNIVGVLMSKSLIGVTEGNISDYITKDKFIKVNEDDTLDDILNYFTTKKQHIAIVENKFKTVVGIVTLEDIVEEILNREIVDETDNVEDMRELI